VLINSEATFMNKYGHIRTRNQSFSRLTPPFPRGCG